MTLEQLTDQIIKHNTEIAGLQEKLSSAHKRLDENERITESIHKLAANVETIALQVKHLTENTNSSIARINASQTSQGERIGALEKEPGTKWKTLVSQVIAIAVAAVVGGFIAKFI